MVQQSLVEYIQKLLQMGYDAGTIRNTLLGAGYSPSDVEIAIRVAQGKPERKIPTKTLAIIFIVILLLAIGTIVTISLTRAPPTQLSLSLTALSTQVSQGQDLVITTEIINPSGRKTSTLIDYTATGPGGRIFAKTESTTITTRGSIPSTIPIPKEAALGSYTLTVTLSYKGKTTTQKLNFEIVSEEKVVPSFKKPTEEEAKEIQLTCLGGCDDLNFCTTDTCVKGECIYTPLVPCCGNGICEEGEQCPIDCAEKPIAPQQIIEKAKTEEFSQAMQTCNEIGQRAYIDSCLNQVAEATKNSAACDEIVGDEMRDACYMPFAYNGDYRVCPKVKSTYLKNSCNTLTQLGKLKTE